MKKYLILLIILLGLISCTATLQPTDINSQPTNTSNPGNNPTNPSPAPPTATAIITTPTTEVTNHQSSPTATATPEPSPTITPAVQSDVTYCRDNLALIKSFHPDFQMSQDTACVHAPAPPNAVINEVTYHNQANFANLNENYQPCTPGFEICKYSPPGTGCGTTAFYMALNYVWPENAINYYDLWDWLSTSNSFRGTSRENVDKVAAEIGILGLSKFNMSWEEITGAIDRKSVIMLHVYRSGQPLLDEEGNPAGWEYTGTPIWPPYEFERYCGPDMCYPGGHWVLIVGYSLGEEFEDSSDDLLIIHDSFTKRMADTPEQNQAALDYGKYLVIKRSTLEERIYQSDSNWTAEIRLPSEDLTSAQLELSRISFEASCPPGGDTCVIEAPRDRQDYSLSCEASVSGMAASYYRPKPPEGFITWEEYFIEQIPRDCNPHLGFRGSIDGVTSTACEPGYGYGVYAEPVAEALNNAGITAKIAYNLTYNEVAEEIRNNRLVIVWISPFIDPPTCEDSVCYIFGEHVWLVRGIKGTPDNYLFLINDPQTGIDYWVYEFPRWEEFKSESGQGNMSIIIGN